MTQPADVAEVAAPPAAAAELAVLLSTAVRIEPALIRAMRLAALPTADVGTEADLWFSDWIGTRSSEAITLLPSVLPRLRDQLRERLRDAAPHDPVHRIWAVLDEVHADTSPALRLEERLVRIWLTGEGSISDELGAAVRALVAERRDGIVDWFAGAWRRLPWEVRGTVPAWQLVQVAVHRRNLAQHFAGAPTPDALTTKDAAVVAPAVDETELGVRRSGTTLTFGETAAQGLHTIRVPDTRPRVLDVIRPADVADVRTVVVHAGVITSVDVGTGPVRLRTAGGEIYELRPTSTPLGVRLRRGAGRLRLPWRGASWPAELRALVRRHEAVHPDADVRLLVRAYRVAETIHRGQYRLSGEAYLAHCLAVAGVLADLGVDSAGVAAGLLHGAVEHGSHPLDELRDEFGPTVAAIVDGVTRLDHTAAGETARVETVRKLVVAMGDEPRVLVVKLADQLENMRTISVLSPPERVQRAEETLEFLVPLARRLGMGVIERGLSDLAFSTLQPVEFARLREIVAAMPDDDALLAKLRERLLELGVPAEVRVAEPYLHAVHQDLARGDHPRRDRVTRDVLVLVDSTADCYTVLGAVHALWRPIPGRFRDTVATPEFRTSRALSTEVIATSGRPARVRIRTHAMHRDAEYGVAALWHVRGVPDDRPDPATWLRQLVDWQRETADPGDFLDGLRFELGTPQIDVFTATGDAVTLPVGSTPIDLAYAVSTELGHGCVAARVNGDLVPLGSALAQGDVVEISTSPGSGPSPEWLSFVVTPRARSKIQQYRPVPRAEAGTAEPIVRPMTESPRTAVRDTSGSIDVPGAPDAWTALAQCCTPLPGEPVFGFVTRSGGVRIHLRNCNVGQDLRQEQPERIVAATWRLGSTSAAFLVRLQIEALTGHDVLAGATRVLAEEGCLIADARVSTFAGRVMTIEVACEVAEPERLSHLVRALRAIDGVYDVYRPHSEQ